VPRCADIILSLLAVVLLAPLFAAIALAVLLAMGRPVLFRQERVGQGGRPFTIVKFRSLDETGAPTRLGTVLRRFSLDELPEFWNVLAGDMALVGPRPLVAGDQPGHPRLRAARQSMLPGITGWAQVRGRNALSFERTYLLDLWYRRRRSLVLDLYILLLTLPVVAIGKGACALAEAARDHIAPHRRATEEPA